MPRPSVPLADLELDLPVPAPSRPVARPLHEGLPDALAAVVGRDPDVVQERMHLRCQESALADDDVPVELAGRPFRDPSLRAVALDVLLDFLAKVTLPGLPIEPFALVFRQVVPRRLQGRRPNDREVRATSLAHPEVHRRTVFAMDGRGR